MISSIRRAVKLETCRCWINSTIKCVKCYTILAAQAIRLKLPQSVDRLHRTDARSMTQLSHKRIWHPSRGIKFATDAKAAPHRFFSSSTSKNVSKSTADLTDKTNTFESIYESLVNTKSAVNFDDRCEIEDLDQDEVLQTESNFKMSEELFRAAKNAEPGSAASFWTHRLYRGPVVNGDPRRPVIHYSRSSRSTEKVLKTFFMDEKVLGFDLEWKTEALRFHGPRANVSLIQISSEERIALLHIALYPNDDVLVSPSLRKLLEDPKVTKVGVSIKADCTRFKKFLGVECRGLFELSHLFKLVKYCPTKDYKLIDKRLVSLAKQVQEQFHLPLFKGSDVRSSDWSKKLEVEQIIYAAADSYAAIQLYKTMEMKRKALIPTPPRPCHAELNIPIKFEEEPQESQELKDKLDLKVSSTAKPEKAYIAKKATQINAAIEDKPEIKSQLDIAHNQNDIEPNKSGQTELENAIEQNVQQAQIVKQSVQINEAIEDKPEIKSQLDIAHNQNDIELNKSSQTELENAIGQNIQQEIKIATNAELQSVIKSQGTTQVEPDVMIQQDVKVPIALDIKVTSPLAEETSRAQFSRDAFFGAAKLPSKTFKNKKSMPLAARMGGGELEATLRAQGSTDINKSTGTQYWTL